jgi:hypothetical protein
MALAVIYPEKGGPREKAIKSLTKLSFSQAPPKSI